MPGLETALPRMSSYALLPLLDTKPYSYNRCKFVTIAEHYAAKTMLLRRCFSCAAAFHNDWPSKGMRP